MFSAHLEQLARVQRLYRGLEKVSQWADAAIREAVTEAIHGEIDAVMAGIRYARQRSGPPVAEAVQDSAAPDLPESA